jgi:sarcosine oxidase subunit beta
LLDGDDILAGAFSPGDGHATPEAVVHGYAFGARACGAEIRTGCEVRAIATSGAKIHQVVTDRGSIATDTVICAAGAWSRSCGAMVGLELPIVPLRRQVLFTEAIDGLPADLPMTIDFASSFYFHREGPGLLMGMSDPSEEPGFEVETSDDWIPELMRIVHRRAPRIAEIGIRGGWAGLYEMTPDHNAIIGEAPGVSRFLYATGFSGHGFLQAPAVGELLRDMVLHRPTSVDIAPLSVERFDAAALRPEYNVV